MSRIETIRQMPVDDLAELLMSLDDGDQIPYCNGSGCTDRGIDFEQIDHDMCKGCMIRFLEAEGNIMRGAV